MKICRKFDWTTLNPFSREIIFPWKCRNSITAKQAFNIRHPCSVRLSYYVRHKAETHENRRFFSTGMEFAENAYAYVLKAPRRS